MPHIIRYDADKSLITTQFEGVVNFDELREVALQVMRLAQEKESFRILSDFRAITAFDTSTLELLELPDVVTGILETIGMKAINLRRAIVKYSTAADDFRFLETVMLNRGHNFRIFQDIDEALAWLLKG